MTKQEEQIYIENLTAKQEKRRKWDEFVKKKNEQEEEQELTEEEEDEIRYSNYIDILIEQKRNNF